MSTIRESIIEAIGTGARTVSAIAAAAKLAEKQVTDNIFHLKRDGIVVASTSGLVLAPGQRMPVKRIDQKDYEAEQTAKPQVDWRKGKPLDVPRFTVLPETPAPKPAEPAKANGNGAALPEPQPEPPRATAGESVPVAAEPVATPAKAPPAVDLRESFVATFGEYVVIRKRDFAELVRAAKVITAWESGYIHFDVPEMAGELHEDERRGRE